MTPQAKPHPKWDKLVRAIKARREPIAGRLTALKGRQAGTERRAT